MKSTGSKVVIHCIIILTLLTTLIIGCAGNQPNEQPSTPPQIPPISSFVMDFADFNAKGNVSSSSGNTSGLVKPVSFFSGGGSAYPDNRYIIGNRKNWGFAALNVGFWSVVGVVGLAIPVATFVECFNHTPEQQSDYTWVWSYDVTLGGDVYTAELHGKYIDNGVRWDMYVSKENDYADFQWYYGESDLPATEGFWILKKDPAEPTDFVRIDWERDLAEGTHSIKYMNIVPGGSENGGYIFHGITTDKEYDRFYEIFNKGKNNHTYIECNYNTKEGRVKDAQHFGDSKWHCWDVDFIDVDCK